MSKSFSLVYGNNIWTHHQLPITSELVKLLGVDRFRMALFEEVHEDRRRMGWGESHDCPWIIGPPQNEAQRVELVKQCLDADVMVYGSCPREILRARTSAGKLTLVSSERMLKKPYHHLRMLNPRYSAGIRKYRADVNHPNVHSLAIGHYAPEDLATIGAFGERVWRWGYFVDVNPAPPVTAPDRPIKILWVGRLLALKNVDVLLRAIAKIKHLPQFGGCDIVGDGPEKSRLMSLARRLNLTPELARFHPSVPFAEVRRLMQESDVYVLSSNRHEGWGAVSGEAMSEGCVLVANDRAGAARELIIEGETGFLYHNSNLEELASLLERLANDYPLRMKVRRQAWERMQTVWHPRVAAERLVSLCHGLLGMEKLPDFQEGPCSKIKKNQI